MSEIKNLTAEELPRLRALLAAFAEEVEYPGYNFEAFKTFWHPLLVQGVGEISYIDVGDEVVAYLAAVFVKDAFSGVDVAGEQSWFVREDKRQNHLGWELFQHFEAQAARRDCKKNFMVHLSNSKEALLPKFYVKHGYELAECLYCKTL